MGFGDLKNRLHIAGLTAKMNGNDRLRLGRNSGCDLIRIQVESIALAVYKHRLGLEIKYYLCCRGEGHGRNYDLIVPANPYRIQCQVKSRGSRIDRNGMLGANILDEIIFESFDLCPAR